MVRFIYVCMGIVALSFLGLGLSFVADGVGQSYDEVALRNDGVESVEVAVAAPTGPSWEEIYASPLPPAAQEHEERLQQALLSGDPSALNNLEPAAADEFSAGFTGRAPSALAEPLPAPAVFQDF